MSRIHLTRAHDLSAKDARERVDHLAEALAKQFEAECTWKGDVLKIEHANVSGTIKLGKKEIILDARLGFLLAMFRDRVDAEIGRILDQEFPEAKA
jgi:putative polyhydroxyalkanoate system protein